MSKTKITIEHTDDEGDQSVISCESSFVNDGSQRPELECIAIDLAKAFVAFESLGTTVPCFGQEVQEAFDDQFKSEWKYWDEESKEDNSDES
jgi:hypothetical protein